VRNQTEVLPVRNCKGFAVEVSHSAPLATKGFFRKCRNRISVAACSRSSHARARRARSPPSD
jgi:hypothetical protein